MNLVDKNISVNSNRPILFSHIIDIPDLLPQNLHLHDYIEIYIYISGDVDFIVEENYFSLKKGDIIITTQNMLHKPIMKSDAMYERFFIGIPADSLAFIDRGDNPLSFVNNNKVLVSVSSNEFKHMISLLNRISQLLQSENTNDFYLILSYFLQFLNTLNSASNFDEYDIENRTTEVPALIKDILKHIDSSASSINSVKEIAEIFHVNPSYLSALFSESTHVNLKQYLITKKISEAKNMLFGELSISDIAYECGFSSCSHFISVFKQVTGKTPREYRNEMK